MPSAARAPAADDKGTPIPEGVRDRALLAVLAYSGIRVGELCRLRVGDFKTSSGLKLLDVRGKGGKERRVPLHPEAVERLEQWLDCAAIRDDAAGPLFRPLAAARGHGKKGFLPQPMTRRAVQYLIGRYVEALGLDPIGDGAFLPRHGPDGRPRTRGGYRRVAGFRGACRPQDDADLYPQSRPAVRLAGLSAEILTPNLCLNRLASS